MILGIRTDKPEAEVGLWDISGKQVSYKTWLAHKELSTTLLSVIHEQLTAQASDFKNVSGIVVFRGPGSFTGLRIGITVANTLAYGLKVPIVGGEGDQWQAQGIAELKAGKNEQIVLPNYGGEAHITPPRK